MSTKSRWTRALHTKREKKNTHAKSCHRHSGTTFIKLRDKINFLLYFFFLNSALFRSRISIDFIFGFCFFVLFFFRWGQRWMTNRKVIARTRDYSANNEMEMIVHHIINSFGKSCPAKTKKQKQQTNIQKWKREGKSPGCYYNIYIYNIFKRNSKRSCMARHVKVGDSGISA